MGDLISIEGRTRNDCEQEEIVDCLSDFMELAQRGEITALAMVCVTKDGDVRVCKTSVGKPAALIGSVTMLQNELLKEIDEID